MGPSGCSYEEWRHVAASNYGHTSVRLISEIHSYSTHYAYSHHNSRFILSRVEKAYSRPTFGTQFKIVEALRQAGLSVVSLPVCRESTHSSPSEVPYWVDGPGNYWFCRRFIKHRQADWSSNTLIERAAVTLADVHRAEVKPWLPAHEFYHFVADRLDPYYWSVLEILNRFGDLVARLHESHMSPDEAIEVMHLAKELPAEARDIDLGPVGLTHADYRPENILVSRRGRILEVIDWDRARPDHQLFDAVVAGLQFAKWNSQRGRNDLQVAHRFVDVYRDACGIDVDAAAVRWMFRFTFVKALLLSRNPGLWLPLFRAYTDTDRSISIPVGSAPVLTY